MWTSHKMFPLLYVCCCLLLLLAFVCVCVYILSRVYSLVCGSNFDMWILTNSSYHSCVCVSSISMDTMEWLPTMHVTVRLVSCRCSNTETQPEIKYDKANLSATAALFNVSFILRRIQIGMLSQSLFSSKSFDAIVRLDCILHLWCIIFT